MFAFFQLFICGFSTDEAGLLLKCGSDPRCVGQLTGLVVVAARADRGVGSEEKLIPLQPIWGSGSLEDAKGEAAASPGIRHCPCYDNLSHTWDAYSRHLIITDNCCQLQYCESVYYIATT
jgi:hypothetical protein